MPKSMGQFLPCMGEVYFKGSQWSTFVRFTVESCNDQLAENTAQKRHWKREMVGGLRSVKTWSSLVEGDAQVVSCCVDEMPRQNEGQ